MTPADLSNLGNLVASGLAAGAASFATGALSEAGKDAYNKLKALVERIVGKDAPGSLEANPESKASTAFIAEQIDCKQEKLNSSELQELRQTLETLQKHLSAEGHGALCEVHINNVVATQGGIAVGGNMINYASSIKTSRNNDL